MIFDKQNQFSDKQAISGAATFATNTLDLGPGNINGSHIRLVVFVEPGATAQGSVSIRLVTSGEAGGSSSTGGLKDPWGVGDYMIGQAVINKGGKVVDCPLPANTARYLAVQYTISGTVTGAVMTAGLVLDADQH